MNSSKRGGFTLIEVMIALALASVAMSFTYMMISEGILFRKNARNLNQAVQLAKFKMTQIDSGNKIQADVSSGDIPGFAGFSYVVEIKEEEINLLEKLKGGDSESGLGDANDSESRINSLLEERGGSRESATGGLIKAYKIRITIKYPVGGNQFDEYTVETFKSMM